MSHTITAVFEHGVFVPQAPVDLPEHAIVKVSLPRTVGKPSAKRFQKLISEPLVVERIYMPSREELHER